MNFYSGSVVKTKTLGFFNESLASQGVIIAVEDNWIKVEEKKKTRIINGDMIRDIAIVPEKKVKE